MTISETLPTNGSRAGLGEAASHLDRSGRYLTFSLAGEVYALDINDVTEIIEFRSLTVVPMMPAFIRGVINLRGRVLPVVDLAARFGQQPTAVGRRTSIIVVETSGATTGISGSDSATGGQDIGIMVDAVNKVIHLGDDDIEPPPAFGAGIRTEFIDGMAKCDDDFIVVLDIEKVLCLDDIATAAQAFQTEGDAARAALAAVGASK